MSNDELTLIVCCGDEPAKLPDHECDLKGDFKEVPSSFGPVQSAHCSICGKPAFNERDIWG